MKKKIKASDYLLGKSTHPRPFPIEKIWVSKMHFLLSSRLFCPLCFYPLNEKKNKQTKYFEGMSYEIHKKCKTLKPDKITKL